MPKSRTRPQPSHPPRPQLALFPRSSPTPILSQSELLSYDIILVCTSGGKDSTACLLHLIEMGIPPSRIELWHQLVDGRETGEIGLMSWPCDMGYLRAQAEAFGVPLYTSWREGGFLREMLRTGERTAPMWYQTPDGLETAGGTHGPIGTRRKFPQPSSNHNVRWCSSSLKIGPAAAAIAGQERFLGVRTLVITGERGQESPARAKRTPFEPHRTDNRNGTRAKRHVDHLRPLHKWAEQHVWSILERHDIRPHPAYAFLGRASCRWCIFMTADHAATVRFLDPEGFERLCRHEDLFVDECGFTMKRNIDLRSLANRGHLLFDPADPASLAAAQLAMDPGYDLPAVLGPEERWTLPAGAFRNTGGPT